MILMTIDSNSKQPKYQQIMDQLRHKIETRILRPGEKLPSTRYLAAKLGVHRSTVALAYQELWSLGYVELKPGTCPRVRERLQVGVVAAPSEMKVIHWDKLASPANNDIWHTYLRYRPVTRQAVGADLIDFSTLDMDCRLFPLEQFRSCLDRVMKEQGMALLGYGDRVGHAPLREYIARRLQRHGISVNSDEILITNGSQQGIDLVLRMLAVAGKPVIVESPTYDHILPLLRFYGLKPVEVPLRPDGMDLAILAEAMKTEKPALVYTMPNFQNPSGVSTTHAHREQLLSLCQEYGVPILEDGFEEEMKYFGKVVLPIKSMDQQRLVIYSGTFSKVLFPGIRIGWIAADRECVERLTAMRSFSEIAPSLILQAAIHNFCESGYYDRHISKMHRAFRSRMQTAAEALRQYIVPEWAEWQEPNGGYLFWLKLNPCTYSALNWKSLLEAHGVRVALGSHFFLTESRPMHMRLSISSLNEAEIVEGVRRLAGMLCKVYEGKL